MLCRVTSEPSSVPALPYFHAQAFLLCTSKKTSIFSKNSVETMYYVRSHTTFSNLLCVGLNLDFPPHPLRKASRLFVEVKTASGVLDCFARTEERAGGLMRFPNIGTVFTSYWYRCLAKIFQMILKVA